MSNDCAAGTVLMYISQILLLMQVDPEDPKLYRKNVILAPHVSLLPMPYVLRILQYYDAVWLD